MVNFKRGKKTPKPKHKKNLRNFQAAFFFFFLQVLFCSAVMPPGTSRDELSCSCLRVVTSIILSCSEPGEWQIRLEIRKRGRDGMSPERDSAVEARDAGAVKLAPSQPLVMVIWGVPGVVLGLQCPASQASGGAGQLAALLLGCFHYYVFSQRTWCHPGGLFPASCLGVLRIRAGETTASPLLAAR